MAMYDWNHNGKNDRQDDYLEYMIYKDCTNDNNSILITVHITVTQLLALMCS